MKIEVTIEEIKEEQPKKKTLTRRVLEAGWTGLKGLAHPGDLFAANPVFFSIIERGLYRIDPSKELNYMRGAMQQELILNI